jgi:hypothetical protein
MLMEAVESSRTSLNLLLLLNLNVNQLRILLDMRSIKISRILMKTKVTQLVQIVNNSMPIKAIKEAFTVLLLKYNLNTLTK